jgi:hypothetical protein
LVAEGVEDISHGGLREPLRAENVSFQAVKTWKASADPDYAAKKARVDHLYAIADGEAAAGPGDPDVVFCLDEFGPLNLRPRPPTRVRSLAGSLIAWQWPDGGWNCDPAATGRRSSSHESLAPAWGLHEYWQGTGDPAARDAAHRRAVPGPPDRQVF